MPTPPSIKISTQAVLVCKIETNDAGTSITWFKGDTEIVADSNIEIVTETWETGKVQSSSMTIKAVDSTHTATDYSCKVNYAAPILSDQSKAGSLTVLGISF